MLTFEDFQQSAAPVKHPVPENPLWPALALGGECGELLNVRKKIERDYEPSDQAEALREHFLEEAGDTLFYLRLALEERGFTLEDAATALISKLEGIAAG